MAAAAPEILGGKFQLDGVLGEGGMGVVLSAHDLELDRRVAIKRLSAKLVTSDSAQRRLLREARAVAKLTSPHTVRVYEVATLEDGTPYIVMEFLEGRDLGTLLEQDGGVEISHAVDYILQTAEALAEAHALGIVHRDLKPANLFLAGKNPRTAIVKVLDFGIAKLAADAERTITRTGDSPGTPAYMAPEQLVGSKDADVRVDIWALGVTLYELISGELPGHIVTAPRLDAYHSEVPAELGQVVERCVAVDPKDRFQTVAELAAALTPFGPSGSERRLERVREALGLGPASVRPPPMVEPSGARDDARGAETLTSSSGVTPPRAIHAPIGSKSDTLDAASLLSALVRPGRQIRRRWIAGGLLVVGGLAAAAIYRGAPNGSSSRATPAQDPVEALASSHLDSPAAQTSAIPQPNVTPVVTSDAAAPPASASASGATPRSAAQEKPQRPAATQKKPRQRPSPEKSSSQLCTDGKNLCPCSDPKCRPP